MVKLREVRIRNTTLIQNRSKPLVAVFFGGTSGIGHYTLRALASLIANGRGVGLRAYIVGRKARAAESVIAECLALYPEGRFKFVQAKDLSLIQNVDEACSEIIQLEQKEADPRIDYLMVSQGGPIFLPRKDTSEGIDITMSLLYYSRMKVITKLLPLLLQSDLPARIVSVFAAGSEAKLFPEDLSLRDPEHYKYLQARSHIVYMHTLFMETLAKQHRGRLSLIHIFPGLVLGPGMLNPDLPWWWRFMARWILPLPLLRKLITVSPGECGERMISLATPRYPPRLIDSKGQKRENIATGTDLQAGSGVYSLNWNGDNNINAKAYSLEKMHKDEMRERVFEHTMKAFEVIEAGKVFTE